MSEPVIWSLTLPEAAGAVAVAYLIGSIPFGLILTRLAGLGDIRAIGSGNIGATNVLRTGNKTLAAFTLLLDFGKGAAGALVGGLFGPGAILLAAVAAVLGHMFPVWLGFKGGKGVATGGGALLAISWPAALAAAATWLLAAILFRISSLSALIATGLAPLYAWYLGGIDTSLFAGLDAALPVGAICALIWIRHHQNIRRLLKGEESRIERNTKGR